MVIQVIQDGTTRCEVYVNVNNKASITIGPAHSDEPMMTQIMEMDKHDLSAFIKMCRTALKSIREDNEG